MKYLLSLLLLVITNVYCFSQTVTTLPTKTVDKVIAELKDYDNLKQQQKTYDSLIVLYQQKVLLDAKANRNLQSNLFSVKTERDFAVSTSSEHYQKYLKEKSRKETWRSMGLGFGIVILAKIAFDALL